MSLLLRSWRVIYSRWRPDIQIRKTAETYGTTIVLVEQNVVNSLAISERAQVMEQGQIVMEGTSQELISDPHIKTAFLSLKYYKDERVILCQTLNY